MIRIGGFLCVENEADWNANYRADWQRIAHNYVAKKPTAFPAFFKFVDSWDSHSCGNWIPCEKTPMVQAVECMITNYQEILNTIKDAD